jgi:hypothetical protein
MMMLSLLRLREYVEAANFARQRAQSERNPHAKHVLQEIERSYHRLLEIEKWGGGHNRPFAHFGLFNGRCADDILSLFGRSRLPRGRPRDS